MLDFLKGQMYYKDNFEGEIAGFDEKTNRLIVNGIDDDEIEKTIQGNIFNSGIVHDIDAYENWEEKLYNALIRNEGKIEVDILSTESGDNWDIEIYRSKTLLNTPEYDDSITIINYAVVFAGKVKGEILSFQYKKYPGYQEDELKKFKEWINDQISEVSEFNYSQEWDTFSSIVVSSAFMKPEEIKLLWNIFNKEIA